MQIDEHLKLLNSKFKYKRDTYKYFDVWNIMYGDGTWEGDCEDYSLTLMWLISDKNFFKFIWNITSFKFLMWFVTAPNGEFHAIVKINGLYYDNIMKRGVDAETLKNKGYKFVYPIIFPIAYVKLLISYTIGRLFK